MWNKISIKFLLIKFPVDIIMQFYIIIIFQLHVIINKLVFQSSRIVGAILYRRIKNTKKERKVIANN